MYEIAKIVDIVKSITTGNSYLVIFMNGYEHYVDFDDICEEMRCVADHYTLIHDGVAVTENRIVYDNVGIKFLHLIGHDWHDPQKVFYR